MTYRGGSDKLNRIRAHIPEIRCPGGCGRTVVRTGRVRVLSLLYSPEVVGLLSVQIASVYSETGVESVED